MNSTVSLASQRLQQEFEEKPSNFATDSQFEEFREPDSPRRLSFSDDFGSGLDSKWLQFFCVVSFDLEKGQFIESTWPKVDLDPIDQKNIAFTSFPDVNLSNRSQDMIWSFQHKYQKRANQGKNSLAAQNQEKEEDHQYYYATCMFHQQKDENVERGFVQKSVVLISSTPLPTFQQLMIFIIGNEFFSKGDQIFEKVIEDILSWPSFQYGKSFDLKLLGENLSVDVPHTFLEFSEKKNELKIPKELVFTPQLQTFRGLWKELWTLWELNLLGEPLLVLGNSPVETCDAVLTLLDSISPISYVGRVHPFFTIHDSCFSEYFGGKKPLKSTILGVSNPHIESLWSHSKLILSTSPFGKNGKKQSLKRELITDYRPLLKPDNKSLLSLLSKEASVEKINEMLSQHFKSLTNMVMAPLERYMASLIPLNKHISIVSNLPVLGEFKEDDFLSILNSSKSSLTSKGKTSDEIMFYRKFLRSDNFKMWFRIRRSQARTKLMGTWLAALENANLGWHLKDKSEVLIIDFYLKTKENVQKALLKVPHTTEEKGKWEELLEQILTFLPEDVMKFNSSTVIEPISSSSSSSQSPNISPLVTPNPSKILVAG